MKTILEDLGYEQQSADEVSQHYEREDGYRAQVGLSEGVFDQVWLMPPEESENEAEMPESEELVEAIEFLDQEYALTGGDVWPHVGIDLNERREGVYEALEEAEETLDTLYQFESSLR